MKKLLPFLSFFFAGTLYAQPDRLGIIEIYGASDKNIASIKTAIRVVEGDRIDRSVLNKAEIEKRIKTVKGISHTDVTLICCEEVQGRSILYIGVAGHNAQLIKPGPDPSGAAKLDSFILGTYDRYNNVLREAVLAGQATENNDQGHIWLDYPPAKPIQDSLIAYAFANLPLLKTVVRSSTFTDHRRAASWIIGFAKNKKEIIADLLIASDDKDETVRNNATRALGVIARYADQHPTAEIKIPAEHFIRHLQSIVWTDRNKSAMLLESLTANRDKSVLNKIERTSLPQIIEMARWKNPGHAMFAFIILGRIAGISEEKIFAAFTSGKRLMVVNEWTNAIRKKQ
ncbi:HEAT repeat domain-containing protein [Terrimonas sp. NA20]|uniref:HEAT repeat domain-containing protein n=1 Tax=Terrimonas ginsenosidimutans TaxID=2908004 RepID=A0ABS9KMU2_9BACT|nr:HEAT repeat domain-containing protein [Terrimonas ginsenosidimutans]MCG2613628.1 HEAT repeat domain-containing protein [Terrimonas ginsenosidimutans]